MSEFLKMDVFFVITSTAVILCILCISLVTWRTLRILAHVEHITERVSHGSDALEADLIELRASFKKGSGFLQSVLSFFGIQRGRASKKK